MTTANVTEIENDFGKFLKMVQKEQEIVILKDGVEIARLISKDRTASLSDSLVGVLSADVDEKKVREERIKADYSGRECSKRSKTL